MNAPAVPVQFHPRATGRATSALEKRLLKEVDGEVLFDAFSLGRYSTDASIYQVEPVGVVVPRSPEAARIALQIAVAEGVPILPRGAGTSQCGQTVGAALVIDNSKYLNQVIAFAIFCAFVIGDPAMESFIWPIGMSWPVAGLVCWAASSETVRRLVVIRPDRAIEIHRVDMSEIPFRGPLRTGSVAGYIR
jgi:hypothetical protein